MTIAMENISTMATKEKINNSLVSVPKKVYIWHKDPFDNSYSANQGIFLSTVNPISRGVILSSSCVGGGGRGGFLVDVLKTTSTLNSLTKFDMCPGDSRSLESPKEADIV